LLVREWFAGLRFGGFGKNPPSTVEVTGLRLAQPGKRSFIVENENGTEDQTLAEAALLAVDGTPPAEESVISEEKAIAKFTALRSRAQAAEIEAAELRGKLEILQGANEQNAAHAEVSPIQREMKKQEVDSLDDLDLTPGEMLRLGRQESAWEKAQATKAEAAEAEKAAVQTRIKSRNAAVAKHPDWQTVIDVGEQHLTAGELLDLQNAGADFGIAAYEKCKAAAERVKPKTDLSAQNEPEKGGKTTTKEVPTQEEILSTVGYVDPVVLAASML